MVCQDSKRQFKWYAEIRKKTKQFTQIAEILKDSLHGMPRFYKTVYKVCRDSKRQFTWYAEILKDSLHGMPRF